MNNQIKYKDKSLDKQYMELFLKKETVLENGEVKKKLEAAYQRAYENRNLEINLFWTRSTFFWGFIAATLGGYIALETNEKAELHYLKFYVICTGVLLSFAWTLVIIGSKHWQKNWEMHLDQLEDYITGPIFKTVYYERKYYSVTKVNLFLSYCFIALWFGLMLDFIITNGHFPFSGNASRFPDFRILIALAVTIFAIFRLLKMPEKKFGDGKIKETFFYRELDLTQSRESNNQGVEENDEKKTA